jgi:hypothetical protein
MDKVERARELYRMLEGGESSAAQIARRAYLIQELMVIKN